MIVIGILLLLLIFLRLWLYFSKQEQSSYAHLEKWFCFLAFGGIICLAAFRGASVGADTPGYIADYFDVSEMDFQEIAYRYKGYELFFWIAKLFTIVGAPIWIWFAFIETIYISAIGRLIFKYSSDKLYSVILFITIGLFSFSLAGLKQVLAMALILHSYLEFVSHRYYLCVILLAVSYFIHPVVFIFIPVFFLYPLKNNNALFVVSITAFLLIFMAMNMRVATYFVTLQKDEHFETYLLLDKSYSSTTLFYYLSLLIIGLLFFRNYFLKSNLAKLELGMLIFACLLQYMASKSPNFFRLAYLYTPFYLIYLPNVFDHTKGKGVEILKVATLIFTIVYFLYVSRDFVYRFATNI